MRSLASYLAACVVVLGLSAARSARADGDVTVHDFSAAGGVDPEQAKKPIGVVYLNPGPILTLVGGRQPTTGYGGEVSAMYFPRGEWRSLGYGAFTQAQVYEGGKYPRFAIGGQAALANAGVELGLAYRQGDDGFVSTLSVHGALFISVGFFVISLRDTLPLNGFDPAHLGFGSESAFTFAIKLPMIVYGHDHTGWGLFGN